MRQKLVDHIKLRFREEISTHNPLKYLSRYLVDDYMDFVIATVYLYTRPKRGAKVKSILFSEMISALGHGLRAKYKLKRDSALAAKTGAFLLYTFDELGFIKVMLGKGKNGHGTFIIEVLNDEALIKLWAKLPSNKIDKLPSETPYEPWTTSRHKNGLSMVRTGSTSVLQSITKETHPIIFSVLNKAQSVGWRINKSIYDLHLWALRNKSEAFSDIWEQQNPEARITKLREAKCIGEIAKRFLDKTFYHYKGGIKTS